MAFEPLTVPGILFAVAGILALSIFPGYFLSLGFFPAKKELSALERLALSVAFSVSFPPFFLFFENLFFGIEINFFSVVATDAVLSFVGVLLFFARAKK